MFTLDVSENDQFLAVAGFVMLPVLLIFVGLIASKALKIRTSAASLIASYTLTTPSILLLFIIFPHDIVAGWIVGLFLACSVGLTVMWMKIFEPESLEQLAEKRLIENQRKKFKVIHTMLKQQLKKEKKAGNKEAEITVRTLIINNKKELKEFKKEIGFINKIKNKLGIKRKESIAKRDACD